ncbi:MAG: TAXI family TRAP transporter solute-binding subunit [Acidilobaceae archaeon]
MAPSPTPTPTLLPRETPVTPTPTLPPGGTGATPTPPPTPPRKLTVVMTTISGSWGMYGQAVEFLMSQAGVATRFVEAENFLTALLSVRDSTAKEVGIIYCALVPSDIAYLAYTGKHERFVNNPAPTSVMWAAFPGVLHLVTTEDSGIKSLADLKGKRVSTGAPGGSTEFQALKLLEIAGIEPIRDFSRWEKLTGSVAGSRLKDRELDAFFYTGPVPADFIESLSRDLASQGRRLYLVPIDDATANKYMTAFPGVALRTTISRTIYNTVQDTLTLSLWYVVVCHKDLPSDVAYSITRTVFENLVILQGSTREAKDTTPRNAVVLHGGGLPYHEGAIRYYREIGVLTR